MVYQYDAKERIFGGHTGQFFLLITAVWLCVSLTSRLLPPLLPVIVDDLAITAFLAGAAITAQRMAQAGMEYPSGRFADSVSRTTVLLGCIAFAIIGLVLLSLATTYLILFVALVVFGIGHGMYAPSSRALLADMFRTKRGLAFGINMMGSEVAGILGAGIAIVVVAVATWRAAFLPIALLLIPLFVAVFLISREPTAVQSVTLDLRPTVGRILGDSTLRLVLVVYSLYVLAASGVATFLPLFLIEVHGVSFAIASAAFALLYVVGILVKPVGGYLSDMLPRLRVAGGSLVIAAGGLGILVVAPSTLVALGGVVVYAAGYRGLPPGLQAFLMDRFPDEHMAGDLGAMRTVYMFIGSLGPAYAGLAAGTVGFVPAFVSFLLFYLIGSAILLWVSRGR